MSANTPSSLYCSLSLCVIHFLVIDFAGLTRPVPGLHWTNNQVSLNITGIGKFVICFHFLGIY